MAGGGKPRHVDADFGDEHARGGVAQAGHRRQAFGGGTKGREGIAEVALQLPHRAVEGLDLGQVQLEHEAMMRRHAAVQRRRSIARGSLSVARCEIGQPRRVRLSRDQGVQNRSPARRPGCR